MKRYLFAAALYGSMILAGMSCKQGDNKQSKTDGQIAPAASENRPATSSSEEASVLSGDTVSIQGRYVLFFGPSNERQVAIMKKSGGDQQIAQTALAFADACKPVMDSLLKAGAPACSFTDSRFVKLTMFDGNEMIIDRNKLKEETGIYMTDGLQVPVLRLGQLTSDEMHQAIRKFFVVTQPS